VTLDLTPCPGCGFTSGGVSLDCETCLQRHPKLFLRAVSDMADELDELRPILVKARIWQRARQRFARAVEMRQASDDLAEAVERLGAPR
jgi:hypothetical protein